MDKKLRFSDKYLIEHIYFEDISLIRKDYLDGTYQWFLCYSEKLFDADEVLGFEEEYQKAKRKAEIHEDK